MKGLEPYPESESFELKLQFPETSTDDNGEVSTKDDQTVKG